MVSKAIVKKANDFGDSIGRLDRIELENFKSYKVVLLLLLLRSSFFFLVSVQFFVIYFLCFLFSHASSMKRKKKDEVKRARCVKERFSVRVLRVV